MPNVVLEAFAGKRAVVATDVGGTSEVIENELSGPSAALPYLNEVRARAEAPVYGDAGFPAPTSKDEMAMKILDERGFEFVFEYKRRPDLIRFGKFNDPVDQRPQASAATKVVFPR